MMSGKLLENCNNKAVGEETAVHISKEHEFIFGALTNRIDKSIENCSFTDSLKELNITSTLKMQSI